MRMLLIAFAFFIFSVIFSNSAFAQTYLNENISWEQNLTPIAYSSVGWGDVDNDGDLDLALTGCTYISATTCSSYISKIYLNNGTSLIESSVWEKNLTPVNVGSLQWVDVNNDGKLDLILTGCNNGGGSTGPCDNGQQTFVYINNGSSLIENSTWQENLAKIAFGDIMLKDINNDGYQDLILTGQTNDSKVSKIYINNGTTFIENSTWEQNLIGVYMGSVDLGDINNDGYLDLVLTGSSNSETTKIYINNGTSFVEDNVWESNLLDVEESSVSFGDYDNDGYLDLLIIGHNIGDRHRVYRNNGNTFILHDLESWNGGNFAGIYDGSVSWGDYNNDGYLDIASTGYEGYTRVYFNNYTNFTNSQENLINLKNGGSICFADIDGDRDLDVISTGYGAGSRQSQIYINNITNKNSIPFPPVLDFNSTFNFLTGKLTLSWGNGSDVETPTLGLYYNIRIGTCSRCQNLVSGVFGGGNGKGYFDNMMQRKRIVLNRPDLENKTIYWAVQTIDTGLAKSAWSTEQVFEITQACMENWTYGAWSSCVNNQQTRTATDLNNCGTIVNRSAVAQSCLSTPSGGSPTGSSSPSPSVTVQNKSKIFGNVTWYFERIRAGTDTGFILNETVHAVNQLWVKVKNEADEVFVNIKKLENKPPIAVKEPNGRVYQYMNITFWNLSAANVEIGKIRFDVNKDWIENGSINKSTILLERYFNNDWQKLKTTLDNEDDNNFYYMAETPGFSIFAITGRILESPKSVCAPGEKRCNNGMAEECSADGLKWLERERCAYSCENGICVERSQELGFMQNYLWLLVPIAVVTVATIGAVFKMKRHAKIGS